MIPLAVALGGALGALSRYGVTSIVGASPASFPWGTLSVNVLGSLALGFLMVWLPERLASEEVRLFATVGLLGSFTTFSTFSYETVELARAGDWGKAIGYTGGSVLLGIVAVLVGAAVALALSSSGR